MYGAFSYSANYPTLATGTYLHCIINRVEKLFVVFHSILPDLLDIVTTVLRFSRTRVRPYRYSSELPWNGIGPPSVGSASHQGIEVCGLLNITPAHLKYTNEKRIDGEASVKFRPLFLKSRLPTFPR
jgi:hypothetical protein